LEEHGDFRIVDRCGYTSIGGAGAMIKKKDFGKARWPAASIQPGRNYQREGAIGVDAWWRQEHSTSRSLYFSFLWWRQERLCGRSYRFCLCKVRPAGALAWSLLLFWRCILVSRRSISGKELLVKCHSVVAGAFNWSLLPRFLRLDLRFVPWHG
jgi:hypothetical protein